RTVSKHETIFGSLRQSVDSDMAGRLISFIESAADHELCRVNALELAARWNIDSERMIATFLHAARLGIFEMSWDVICPECLGILGVSMSLKRIHNGPY